MAEEEDSQSGLQGTSPRISPRDVNQGEKRADMRADSTPHLTPRGDAAAGPAEAGAGASLSRPSQPKLMRYMAGPDDDIAPASLRPILARPEYFSNPSMQKLATLSEKELANVDNFEIGRHGFGSIKWPGLTDLRRVNLDELVQIDRGNVTVYPEIEMRPAKGSGLNKEAVICLNVRPSRGDVSADQEHKLMDRIRNHTEQAGNIFISYDLKTWIFRVPHFDGSL